MSTFKSTFLNGLGHGANQHAPQLDLTVGGQHGYHPNFGQLTNNTAYVPQNIIPIVMVLPRGFQYIPDSEKWAHTLKSLIEVQSRQITGLRSGLTVEAGERAIGGAGHMAKDAVNVTEAMSTPTHVWDVNYNKGIPLFWERYIRLFISEPITKQMGLMNLPPLTNGHPTDRLVDLYSFTTLYIEPDPTRQFALDAWLAVNEFPTVSGELEYQFDMAASAAIPEISIEFACTPVRDQGVLNIAQGILEKINYVNAGPMQRSSVVQAIEADLLKAERGYTEDIIEAVNESIR